MYHYSWRSNLRQRARLPGTGEFTPDIHREFIDDGEILMTLQRSREFVMDRNIIVANGRIRLESPSAVSQWTNNLFFSQTGQYAGIPETEQGGAPVFMDPAKLDYRFKPGSVGPVLGIKPLDFSRAGPRHN
jgi:hypothetical protein